MTGFPNPADLKPGDLIFTMDSETGNPVTEDLFTVDDNRGPCGADQLRREDWNKGWCEIRVRCQEQCSASDCRPPEFRHCFLLGPGDFVYAKDVVWA